MPYVVPHWIMKFAFKPKPTPYIKHQRTAGTKRNVLNIISETEEYKTN
jgi:hypothetical protein